MLREEVCTHEPNHIETIRGALLRTTHDEVQKENMRSLERPSPSPDMNPGHLRHGSKIATQGNDRILRIAR